MPKANKIVLVGQHPVSYADVVRYVLEGLAREHERDACGNLLHLVRDGLATHTLLNSKDHALVFRYSATEDQYAEATGQDRCVRCKKWSAFCKPFDEGEVCDFCRAAQTDNTPGHTW